MATMTGYQAIEFAERAGLTLSKYTDPTEQARTGLSPAEAREVAREDAGLIFINAVAVEHAFDAFVRGLAQGDANGCKLAGTEMDVEWSGEHTDALADFLGCRVSEIDESDLDAARKLYANEARKLMA